MRPLTTIAIALMVSLAGASTQRVTVPDGEVGPVPDWQQLPFYGGSVSAIAVSPIDPLLMFAGIGEEFFTLTEGLHRSVDGGFGWREVPTPFSGSQVLELEFDSSGTLYAGARAFGPTGLFKSSDRGRTWNNVDLGIGPLQFILDIEMDPQDDRNMWLGLDDSGPLASTVFRSTDGGISWQDVTPPLSSSSPCNGIAVDPLNSQRVFACFGNNQEGFIWATFDGGASWVERTFGPGGVRFLDIEHDGQSLWVAGGHFSGATNFGLRRSDDEGLNWFVAHDSSWPSLLSVDVELNPHRPGDLLVSTRRHGVMRTTDGGVSWQPAIGGTRHVDAAETRFHPTDPDQVFLGAEGSGFWRANGTTTLFRPSSDHMRDMRVVSSAVNPLDPLELALAFNSVNSGGLATSRDGGQSFRFEAAPTSRYSIVRFSPHGVLHAVLEVGPQPSGVYRRTGGAWQHLGPPASPPIVQEVFHDLEFDPSDPNWILAVGRDNGVSNSEPTIWRSIDGGVSWTKVYEDFGAIGFTGDVLRVDGPGGPVLLAAVRISNGPGYVLRSTDGGATWVRATAGLPAGFQGRSLSAAESGGCIYLFDRGNDELHASADFGLTWRSVASTEHFRNVFVRPSAPNEFFALKDGPPYVLRSGDGGATFQPFGVDLGSGEFVFDLLLDPTQDALFLGTSRGIFRHPLTP